MLMPLLAFLMRVSPGLYECSNPVEILSSAPSHCTDSALFFNEHGEYSIIPNQLVWSDLHQKSLIDSAECLAKTFPDATWVPVTRSFDETNAVVFLEKIFRYSSSRSVKLKILDEAVAKGGPFGRLLITAIADSSDEVRYRAFDAVCQLKMVSAKSKIRMLYANSLLHKKPKSLREKGIIIKTLRCLE